MVILAVGQAVDLLSGASGPRHSEEQRVRLDHVRVAGFKLAAGNQQGGEGARLGLDPGARLWVQGNLLLPRRDLLYRTAHILDGERDVSGGFRCGKGRRCLAFKRSKRSRQQQVRYHVMMTTHTFLFL